MRDPPRRVGVLLFLMTKWGGGDVGMGDYEDAAFGFDFVLDVPGCSGGGEAEFFVHHL